MDTLIFLVSTTVLVILGCGALWTVRAVRRVGLRRFAGAVGALVWALLLAGSKLFLPSEKKALDRKAARDDGIIDAFNNVQFADEALHRSLSGTITPEVGQ